MISLLAVAAAAFVTASVTLRLLLSERFKHLALDRPNERSLHARVTPRTGGLAVLSGAWAAFAFAPAVSTAILGGLGLCLGGVSFVDDRRGLPILLRLGAQLSTALGAAFVAGHGLPLPWLVISVFAIVWMTNLYNFMDGSDGLAGGMGVAGFAAFALAYELDDHHAAAALCAALAAGCIAFLRYNYPPARIFMGDVGSTVLGFCAAALGLHGISLGTWPLWFPALVFSPFAVDATVTLLRRALRREKVWRPHREHYYQRLIRSGRSHAWTAKAAYALMAAVAISALLALELAPSLGWYVLAGWLAGMAFLMSLIDVRWARAAPG